MISNFSSKEEKKEKEKIFKEKTPQVKSFFLL